MFRSHFRFYNLQIPLLILFFACILAGCEKEEKITPEFVGTWYTTWESISEGDTIHMKEKLVLTETTYEDYWQFYHPILLQWKSWVGTVGTLSFSGYTLKINLNRVGVTDTDAYGYPDGTLIYFNKGSSDYNEITSTLEISSEMQLDFSIAGNTMTILFDRNEDGDFSDPGEAMIMSRE